MALAIIGLGVVAGFTVAAVRGLPSLTNLEPNPALTSFIYDINGEVVAEISAWENRIPVSLAQVPQPLVDAFIASEDARFWTHHGIDLRGILRALYRDIISASTSEGASTITQQLARNAFNLGYQKTVTRKLQEVILAVQIERRYTKQEVLEMYLNQIHFGHNAYGVQAAAKLYFGKDVSQLALGEAAMIAGVAKSGNIYSPYVDAGRAKSRRDVVLDQMARYGKITQAEADAAKALDLVVTGIPAENYPAAYFVDYILEQLLDAYGADTVYRGGLKVYTTIDMTLQRHLEKAYADILDKAMPLVDKDGKPQEAPQAASVFIEPTTGGIRAMVGGRDHKKKLELNRAVPPRGSWEGTLRQPGSAFKPIVVYAPAFELGWSPGSVLTDSVKTWIVPGQDPWSPENYTQLYRGQTSLRTAVEASINTMAIKLIDRIGIETGVRYARKFGIDSLVTEGVYVDLCLAVAIGGLTEGVSVLDMARAYCVFANGGVAVKAYSIVRVEDKFGSILQDNQPQCEVAISEQAAYLMTDVLKGVILRGTGAGANFGRPAAGKTGTTDEDKDAWFIGYTPDIVGALWMGFDQPKEMKEVFGATYCAPIWRQAVSAWLKDKPVRDWKEPSGLVRIVVCGKSGLLPGASCPSSLAREELFIQGRQPMAVCDVHMSGIVCAQRPWQLARQECLETVAKSFIRRPEPYEKFQKLDEETKLLWTYIPEDAAEEYPNAYCELHDPNPIPPYPGPTMEVSVTAVRYSFTPNTITVPAGTQLTLKITAADTNHGFTLPGYGLDVICLRGQQTTITFICDKPGTFPFRSGVYSGKNAKNMTGALIVTGG
jgi:penicillin-binding protein 1A